MVCGVTTGLKPPIRKRGAVCQHLNYVGNRVSLSVTGRVQLIACTGDAGLFADPAHTVYLHDGKTWSAGGLTCTEAIRGLTCRNRDGHGFFLSLRGWSVFSRPEPCGVGEDGVDGAAHAAVIVPVIW